LVNQRKPEMTFDVTNMFKTRERRSDQISTNQHFASTFSMQKFKFLRHSCKLSFLFPPRRQIAPESLLAGYCLRHCHLLLKGLVAWHGIQRALQYIMNEVAYYDDGDDDDDDDAEAKSVVME